MKKTILIAIVCMFSIGALRSQSVSDDITQLTLDVQKLSQMKQILSDMEKAYTVVYKGYEDIKNTSQGVFNLHKIFLDGLLAVSPAVANYEKVADILNNESLLVKQYSSANSVFRASGRFSSQELDYFSNVYINLFNSSLTNLDELAMVLTASQLRMSDAERLAAIDRLDRDVSGKLSFLQTFNNKAAIESAQQGRDENDIGVMRELYGIPPHP